jgi:hypothetical protein
MIRRIALLVAVAALPAAAALSVTARRAEADTAAPPPTASTKMAGPLPFPTFSRTPLLLPNFISFNTVANGSIIDTAFSGLTFAPVTMNASGALVTLPGHIYATTDPSVPAQPCTLFSCAPGGNVVTMNPPPQNPWIQGAQGAIQIKFATPVAWASIAVRPSLLPESLGTPTNEPYLVAYGPNGYLGEAVLPYAYGTPQWNQYNTLQYNAPAGQTISFILLSTQQRGGPPVLAEFDNLSYPR